MVHTTLAAFGLSVILAQSAMAFSVIKYLGASYLVYLGAIKLFSKDSIVNTEKKSAIISVRKTYWSAVMTNVLNPKVAIFFLAFFPQFIRPEYLHNATPFIILGVLYAIVGIIWFMMLTFFASTFSARLKSNHGIGNWLNKFAAITFLLMGLKVALTKK